MKRTVQGSRIGDAQTYLLNLVVLAIFVGMGLLIGVRFFMRRGVLMVLERRLKRVGIVS